MAEPSFQQPPAPGNQPDPKKKDSSAPEVYTMPTQYLTGQKKAEGSSKEKSAAPKATINKPKSGGTKKIILIVATVFIGLAILGGGGYFVLNYVLNSSENAPQATNQPVIANLNTSPANANTNENANSRLNANANENENSNANTNENANKEDDSNENANTNSSGSTNAAVPVTATSTTDTDNDGLTDVEEKIYGTKINQPDTDEDGFLDGEEVKNGYNPLGEGKIIKLDKVKKYENKEFGYSIYYPIAWIAEALNEEDAREVLFTSDTGEFMEVIATDNPSGQSVEAWYKSQFPEYTLEELDTIKVSGDTAVKSPDGFTVYWANDNYVYAFTYKYGTKKEVNFLTSFEMMYKSFVHKLVEALANENKS